MSKKIISLISFVIIIALMSAGARWLISRYTLGQALIIGVSIIYDYFIALGGFTGE